MLQSLGWVDLGMLAFLALSTLAGLVRGVVFELMSLAGWFVAYFSSIFCEPYVLPLIAVGLPGSALNHLIALASVFVAVLILWGLLARLLRSLIRATPLSVLDRLLGAGFGLARGALVLVLVVFLVGFTPWSRSTAWREAQGVVWARIAAAAALPFLPFPSTPTPEGGAYVRHRWRHLEEPGQPVDL